MIEAIQVAAAPPTATATATATAQAGAPSPASAYDLRDFASAMQQAGGAAPPAAATGPVETQPSEGTRAVLSALEHLNGGAENVDAMSKAMTANSADLTPGEVMQMTMRCHQFLFTSELTSNVANRTSDGIQQLFRQQS